MPSRDDPRYEHARRLLVTAMERENVIVTPAIAEAFRAVPREAFVPPAEPDAVYADTTIPVPDATGAWLTTSSQPGMMALMLEQLQVRPGDRVLEIGTGTGYNAAILSRLAGPAGCVVSVEVEPESAENARAALEEAGYPVEVHAADGADGWAEGAPYDRILATVAVWDVPEAWLAQLHPDGRLVAPLTVLGGEFSLAFEREKGVWASLSTEPCAFVRFKGRMSHPNTWLSVGDVEHPALVLWSEPAQLPQPADLRRWLGQGVGAPLEPISERGAWEGFVLHTLQTAGPRRLVRAVSHGAGLGWRGAAIGLWDADGLSLVTASGRLEHFGCGRTEVEMRRCVDAWRETGRPSLCDFRFRLLPGSASPGPGRLLRWKHTLVIERAR